MIETKGITMHGVGDFISIAGLLREVSTHGFAG